MRLVHVLAGGGVVRDGQSQRRAVLHDIFVVGGHVIILCFALAGRLPDLDLVVVHCRTLLLDRIEGLVAAEFLDGAAEPVFAVIVAVDYTLG